MSKIVKLIACFLLLGLPADPIRGEILVPGDPSTTWSFKEDGKQPADNWNGPGFDDSQWRRGSGPFGFGEDGIATEVASSDGTTITLVQVSGFRTVS